MTIREILSRIHGQLAHNDEAAERLYLPDLFTFFDNALNDFLSELWDEERRKDLLLTTFSVTLTSSLTPYIYTGSLASAKAAGLRQQPPWRQVSLPDFHHLLYTPFPLVDETPRATAQVSYYTLRGDTLFVETLEPVTVGSTAVTITAYKYPVADTVTGTIDIPQELISDLVTYVVNKLAEKKQLGVRI